MQLLMAYAILGVFGFSLLWLIKWPQVALALFLGMYAAEQILIANIPYFRNDTEIYNYFVGVVGVVAIIISIVKNGVPKFDVTSTLLFISLFGFSALSLLWTSAPNTGMYAVTHFAGEGVLGFLLPFFLLRREGDIYIVIWVVVTYAFITAIALIFFPISGTGGRVLLVEGGTVLSPATLVGSAIILLAGIDKNRLPILHNVKYVVMTILMAGCFISGARTQFFVSVALAALVVIIGRRQTSLIIPGIISGVVLFGAISFFMPSSLEDSALIASDRYHPEAFEAGFQDRIDMISSVLKNKQIIIGHGVMGWAHWVSGRDTKLYPHNSLAQIYFELGIVGLILFLSLIGRAMKRGFQLFKWNKHDRRNELLAMSLLCFLLFNFILSLKQGTFMSCTNVYIGVAIISVYYRFSRKEVMARYRAKARKTHKIPL